MNMLKRRYSLQISREDIHLMFTLIWPCILENMTATLVSLVDTAMVGSIGAVATAAVGLCTSPSWLMNGFARSLGVGGTAIVARAIGAGKTEEAIHTGKQVFRVALLLGLFITLLTYFGAPIIPVLMRGSKEVCENATLYLKIISSGYLFHYSAMTMGALLRGAGDTRTPMITGLFANLMNVIGNFLLIYPSRFISIAGRSIHIWGADLGIRGAAISSALSLGLAGFFLLLYMFSQHSDLRISFAIHEPFDLPLLKRVLRISLPAAMERITINMGQIIYASMIASIGTAEVAAFHITSTVESLGYMPANGFSTAASTMVGQKLGSGEPEHSQRLGTYTILSSVILLTLIGFFIYLSRVPMTRIFTTDPVVAPITANMLILCGLIQPFNALCITATGALNGAGDTLFPFIFSLFTMWGIRILFSYLLGFTFHYGVFGIYFAMIIDLAIRGLMLNIRFLHGKWKIRKV